MKKNKTIITILLLINGIVLYNALFHLPWIGYDAIAHMKNIDILSKFRLPVKSDTYMFYMPPASYFLPALIYSSGKVHPVLVAKFTQLLNVLYSIGLTFYLIKICGIIRPGNKRFKIVSLAFLGIMPVYYKTFAFIRGEPLVAFLAVFAIYKSLVIFGQGKYSARNTVILGLALGLAILTRQSGFFIFPAIALFAGLEAWRDKEKRALIARTAAVAFFIALLAGGWFYMHLFRSYRSVVAFNVTPQKSVSLHNQDPRFYTEPGFNKLFSDPIRDAFTNRFIPTFYSEFWGDYLCYFVVYGRDMRDRSLISGRRLAELTRERPFPAWLSTNRDTIKAYLGRVNAVSIFPTILMFLGVMLGAMYFMDSFYPAKPDKKELAMFSLLFFVIASSFICYLYFLIRYVTPKGDNIKATYMIITYPFIAILAGELVGRIKGKSFFLYAIMWLSIIVAAIHNFPVFLTRYIY